MDMRKQLRLLLPAALLAATAIFGGSTVADPAAAVAAPVNDFNEDSFEACARGADEGYLDGKLTDSQWDDLLESCCLDSGGFWTPTVFPRCTADPAAIEPLPKPGVAPPSEAATQPPPSPRLPVVPQPTAVSPGRA